MSVVHYLYGFRIPALCVGGNGDDDVNGGFGDGRHVVVKVGRVEGEVDDVTPVFNRLYNIARALRTTFSIADPDVPMRPTGANASCEMARRGRALGREAHRDVVRLDDVDALVSHLHRDADGYRDLMFVLPLSRDKFVADRLEAAVSHALAGLFCESAVAALTGAADGVTTTTTGRLPLSEFGIARSAVFEHVRSLFIAGVLLSTSSLFSAGLSIADARWHAPTETSRLWWRTVDGRYRHADVEHMRVPSRAETRLGAWDTKSTMDRKAAVEEEEEEDVENRCANACASE